MKITIPVEIRIDELCRKVEESLNEDKELSRSTLVNVLMLLKYLNEEENEEEEENNACKQC